MISKKFETALVAVGVFSLAFTAVSAETPAQVRMENREERQEMRVENRMERQEVRQENRQERREFLTEVHANRLERRFAAYENRLNNIIARIEKRLTTLKNEGKNVSELESKLANAKLNLATAVSQGGEAVAKFRAIQPEKFEQQKSQALMARDTAQAARQGFEAVLKSLKEIVQSMKTLE